MKIIKAILDILSFYTLFILIYLIMKLIASIDIVYVSEALRYVYRLLGIPLGKIYHYLEIFHLGIPVIMLGLFNMIYCFVKKESK